MNRSNRRNIWSIRSVQNIPLIAEQIFLYSGPYIHRIQVNIFFLSKLIYSSYSGPYIPPILVLILPTILVHIVILFRSIYSSYSGQYIFLLFWSIYIPPILVKTFLTFQYKNSPHLCRLIHCHFCVFHLFQFIHFSNLHVFINECV